LCPSVLSYPIGVVLVGDKKTLAITDRNHRVVIVTTEGTFLRQIGSGLSESGPNDFCYPSFVCVLPDGETLVVSDQANHRLQVVKVDGTFVRQIGNGEGSASNQFKITGGVCVTPSGTLVVCDYGNNRLQILE
jgi:DNA-binding beta-propeller fold protein YncE